MKIVLTGGPSAGKTSAVEVLHRTDENKTIVVQEAASILFKGGFPRRQEPEFVVCQQRAIFYVQRELEDIAAKLAHGRAIICDRGSLDGLAYWPESESSFFNEIGSSMAVEIARYDWVIHLDTASNSDYQATDVRLEKIAEALAINEKVKIAWSRHPRRIVIPNHTSFVEKIQKVVRVVNMILAGASIADIQLFLK